MTRPLCPYPQTRNYKGSGDTNDYTNFTCYGSSTLIGVRCTTERTRN